MKSLMKKFFLGINYWDSKNATDMWKKYDSAVIEEDFKKLRDAGVTVLRVFPLWSDFQPLTGFYANMGTDVYEFGMNGKSLPDTEAGRAGVSEEMCLKFENFCNLAEKYGFRLITALITGQMSFGIFAPPVFQGRDLLFDAESVKWQVKFVKYFVSRFKNKKAIAAWDLGNEMNYVTSCDGFSVHHFYNWCALIANTAKSCDSTRPVISGMEAESIEKNIANLKDLGEICDMHTAHVYNIFCTPADPVNSMKPILDISFKCRLGDDIAKIPTFAEEFGAIGYMNCSEKTEAEFYRGVLMSCLAHNSYGAMWWCAFDQGHINIPPYNWNNIGSEYGFFRKDGSYKPVAEENKKFAKLLEKLPEGLPEYERNCTIIIPREDDDYDTEVLRSAYILAKQANLDASFTYALDPIPDSPVYIFPCIGSNKAITKTRFDELIKKVEEGAVLYISLDTAYFRDVPKLAGVRIDARMDYKKDKTLFFGEKEFRVSTNVNYDISADGCEVLAEDECGSPVFVKNKCGKGEIYFLFVPLEKYLSQLPEAFFCDEHTGYDLLYRCFAQKNALPKTADTDSPYIRLTEHKVNENSGYLFFINYSHKERSANIIISEEYSLTPVWGELCSDKVIKLRPCDGVILKAERVGK